MIDEPAFYLAAVPAVLIMGISKGGFGSGVGLLATPLIALTLPMSQAAAIMLPILIVMDLVGLWAYRGTWSRENMPVLLAGGLAGILLGALTFRYFDDRVVRLAIGVFALGFAGQRLLGQQVAAPTPRSRVKGLFWSTVSGLSSTIIHAGGPPLNVYLLPQRLDKAVFVGTTVVFFAVVNAVKLVPYTALGLFDSRNLLTSAVLAPFAPVGILAGLWLMRRVPEEHFYRICYLLLMLVGGKLLYDGIFG